MVINQVSPDDDGYYYCMARDYVNGDLDNKVLVQDRVRVLVRRRDAHHLLHQPPFNRQIRPNKQHSRPKTSNQMRNPSSSMPGDIISDMSTEIDSDGLDMDENLHHRNMAKLAASRRKFTGRRPVQQQQTGQRLRQKLIQDSLSRSRQTTSISTWIKYLSTDLTTHSPLSSQLSEAATTLTTIDDTSSPMPSSQQHHHSTVIYPENLIEHKRAELTGKTSSSGSSSRVVMSSTAIMLNRVTGKTEKAYVNCPSDENTCLNGGVCYITNPSFYTDSFLYNQEKIKFCM